MGARNSAVVVDLPRCEPMLSPRVPNLVPIPGPRMERETPGQRPRPNYGHPQGCRVLGSPTILDTGRLSANALSSGAQDRLTMLPQKSIPAIFRCALWVPETLPWSLTCRDAGRCSVFVYRIMSRFFVALVRLAVRSRRSKDLEIIVRETLWVPETRPWSLTCRDAGRC